LLTFTLDTNCIIAVDEKRSEANAILELVSAHRKGLASVGLVAISASEQQRSSGRLENFEQFQERISKLGLGELDILLPMAYCDVSFYDHGLFSDDTMVQGELKIHEILFPNVPFLWSEHCAKVGLDPETNRLDKKWRNAKCDVQAFWSHVYGKRNVFVTSDENFHAETKKPHLILLAGGYIETPESAVNLIRLQRDKV
jgi:hypothetical protein